MGYEAQNAFEGTTIRNRVAMEKAWGVVVQDLPGLGLPAAIKLLDQLRSKRALADPRGLVVDMSDGEFSAMLGVAAIGLAEALCRITEAHEKQDEGS